MTGAAVLLVSHGTVDDLRDLPAFLTNIRRGRPAPPELVAEMRRRYEAIGGRSPLNATNAALAAKLAKRLRVPVAASGRLWRPYAGDVLADLVRGGAEHVAVVPLAQYSTHVYEAAVREVAPTGLSLSCANNWGDDPGLVRALAARARPLLAPDAMLLLTAHSLPLAIVAAGDPYDRDVRKGAELVARELGHDRWRVEYQSQGMGGGAWLGDGLRAALERCATEGVRRVVAAPFGFLADHVETLYDLDVEAAGWARELEMDFVRAPSLGADDDLVEVLADVTKPLLAAA
jgi:ferrochelatase